MLKNSKFYLSIAITYTLVLLYFSLANADGILPENDIKYQDKILHFGAYIGLAVLWGLYVLVSSTKKGLLYSFFATLVFGITLELVQEIINPLRTYDIYDLLANCIGVLFGTILVIIYKNLKLKS